jgi:Polyketide cyclase / dehydrase and lipid transport
VTVPAVQPHGRRGRWDVSGDSQKGSCGAYVLRQFVAAAGALGILGASVAGAASWERVHASDDLTVDTRPHPGSEIKEVRAYGMMAVPPHVVRAVIADVARYPEFMPYVKESRVIARSPRGTITYQRVSFGVVGALGVADRDYILRNVERVASREGRTSYKRIWNAISGNDPPQPGVVRLSVSKGFWELSPADEAGSRTRVVYCIFTNPGGSLPLWAINQGNSFGVPKVFNAVRKTAMESRYQNTPLPDLPALMVGIWDFSGLDESMCTE